MKNKFILLIISIIHYSYYRYHLHLLKQWDDDKSISRFNVGFGYSYSLGSLVGLLIFIIDDFFDIENYVNLLIIISISVLTIATLFLPKIEFLEDKYKDYNQISRDWKIKGILSLTLVFGPPLLLILYMFLKS